MRTALHRLQRLFAQWGALFACRGYRLVVIATVLQLLVLRTKAVLNWSGCIAPKLINYEYGQ